jgi:glycosyltransferase involved in cell wall biosynthesis
MSDWDGELNGATSGLDAFRRPLKVCVISPLGYGLYCPESGVPFGGAELQSYLLATNLARDPAFSVTVLTTVSTDPGEEQYGPVRLIKRRAGGRTGPLFGAGTRGMLEAIRGYVAAFADMRALLRSVDADVYVHAGAGLEVGVYAWICRKMGKRFVYVVASTSDLDRPYGTVTGPFRWLYPLGIRWADAVVCRTNDQRVLLKTRYRRDGVLIRTGHPVPTTLHASRFTPRATSAILWIGRLHPVKQPERFLDLAEQMPDQPCVLIGMRDAAHPEVARAVADRAAGLFNLTVLYDVPPDRIAQHLRTAKVLVNTSVYEGFSNTFVQAAMAGVPICSLTVDPDGLLTRQEIGLCAGGRLEMLVASVRALSVSERQRQELGRRAFAYAATHHDLRCTTDDFKLLVQRLVGAGRKADR